ncbi:MAG: 4-hydroxy-tetrahydrodipicolinate reductase [Candidatus Omnitrophica bacterium]|nr:4-hydroxy-tetrahydrodipicolinate reductase [Candidatus Omnitrophota bacterium]
MKKRVAVCGACGRMGSTLIGLLNKDADLLLSVALESEMHSSINREILPGVKISSNWQGCENKIDIIIDFTAPVSTLKNLEFAHLNKIPIVIGTTGFSKEEKNKILEKSKSLPILFSPNMSPGVHLMMDVVEYAAKILSRDYEVEILETHHHNKKDAPSGTALKLGEIICKVKNLKPESTFKFSRHNQTGPRNKDEIGIHAVRMGDIIGEHSVFFAGTGETIEITHRCLSRESFAAGAILGAKFLLIQKSGMYEMKDVINWMKGENNVETK